MALSMPTGPGLTFRPVIELDASTQTYAAWCDELEVATSAKTEEEARTMLADAMLMAAAFTVQHRNTLRWDLLAQLPFAEMIHGKSAEEIRAILEMAIYNYGQLHIALKRSQFINTASSSKHQRWEKIEADGTPRRVILNANKLAPVPPPVLERLLHSAAMDEAQLRKLLGFT